jgi:hypothetical protein
VLRLWVYPCVYTAGPGRAKKRGKPTKRHKKRRQEEEAALLHSVKSSGDNTVSVCTDTSSLSQPVCFIHHLRRPFSGTKEHDMNLYIYESRFHDV